MKKDKKPEDRAQYASMTKEERLQSFKRTIAHPHLEAADKSLREAIQETGGASLINVYGPARVGKSTMKNHVIRNIILEMLPLLEQDRERIPLLSMTPKPPMNSTFNWKTFFQDALRSFDEPLIDNKIVIDTSSDLEVFTTRADGSRVRRKPPEGTKDALRQSFETAAKRRRPVAIFLDEAQHLGKVNSTQLQNQLDCIKSLADDTGTIIVLIGTYELLPLRNLSAQLIGRCLDIHFPRYRSTQKELSQFKNVLRTFQNILPFVEETDVLLKNWEFCYERSIGCVGNLRLMLVRAVHAALWSNKKNLSWKDIQTHAFSEAESYEMMLEAYEGERVLASKPGQREKLRAMLGLDVQSEPQKEQELTTAQGETPSEGEKAQVDQTEDQKDDVKQEPSVVESTVDASAESKASQDERYDKTKTDVKLESLVQETTNVNSCQEGSVARNQSAEITATAESNMPDEGASASKVSLKPLKKPKVTTPSPFRRRPMRDRTGGPQQG